MNWRETEVKKLTGLLANENQLIETIELRIKETTAKAFDTSNHYSKIKEYMKTIEGDKHELSRAKLRKNKLVLRLNNAKDLLHSYINRANENT